MKKSNLFNEHGEIRGQKKSKVSTLFLLFIMIFLLSGCKWKGPQYSEESAYDLADAGKFKMEEWMELYFPGGKVLEAYPYEFAYPSGPSYLTDYVRGNMFDGERERSFSINVRSGKVTLEADDEMLKSFKENSKALFREGFGLKPDDEIKDFDAMLLYEPLDIGNPDWGANHYQTEELPGELVAENGDIESYVRDTDRYGVILLYGFIIASEEDLEAYEAIDPEKIEESFGVFFGNGPFLKGFKDTGIQSDGAERLVDKDKEKRMNKNPLLWHPSRSGERKLL